MVKSFHIMSGTISMGLCHCGVFYTVCRELWDGPRAGTEDAVEFTGVDEVGYPLP